jgi:hypothetical protein
MTDLPRITSRLSTAGFAALLAELAAGPLLQKREFAFHSLKPAKAAMALLYSWLRWHPAIKVRTTLRLDLATAILTVIPRSTKEKRGRKPNVY